MGTSFIEYNPNQVYLLPLSPGDWLAEGHLAYFIRDTVEQIDLRSRNLEGQVANDLPELALTRLPTHTRSPLSQHQARAPLRT